MNCSLGLSWDFWNSLSPDIVFSIKIFMIEYFEICFSVTSSDTDARERWKSLHTAFQNLVNEDVGCNQSNNLGFGLVKPANLNLAFIQGLTMSNLPTYLDF